jgi:hypothetical protein
MHKNSIITTLVMTDIVANLEHSDISIILQFPDRLVDFVPDAYLHIV